MNRRFLHQNTSGQLKTLFFKNTLAKWAAWGNLYWGFCCEKQQPVYGKGHQNQI
jgi:hypothetical protein